MAKYSNPARVDILYASFVIYTRSISFCIVSEVTFSLLFIVGRVAQICINIFRKISILTNCLIYKDISMRLLGFHAIDAYYELWPSSWPYVGLIYYFTCEYSNEFFFRT